jgi:hypothetical protein
MKIETINERQFAKVVGLSYGFVKTLRQKRQIPCLRIGRAVRYKYPEHVEQFLNKREHKAAERQVEPYSLSTNDSR